MLLTPPDLERRTGPDPRTTVRGLLLGALAPRMVLWLAIAGIGLLLTGPFKVWDRTESALNRSLQDTRSQTWDSVTAPWSHVGNTEIIIGVSVVAARRAFAGGRDRRQHYSRGCSPDSSGLRRSI